MADWLNTAAVLAVALLGFAMFVTWLFMRLTMAGSL